jgi:hypothetical protein
MTSAAIAVTLSARRLGKRVQWAFMLISLIFGYTTIVNIIEEPEGLKIATIFIAVIIISSLVSRVWRSTELRVERIELDDMAREFIRQAARGTIRIITNRVDTGEPLEYPSLTPLLHSCFSCATRPANCHTYILVGARATRFPTL